MAVRLGDYADLGSFWRDLASGRDMNADHLQGAVIDSEKYRCVAFHGRERRGHVRAPHGIHARSLDRPIMGLGTVRVTDARGSEPVVFAHQAQCPDRGCPDALAPQASPDLPVAFSGKRT